MKIKKKKNNNLPFQIWTLKICNHGKIPAVLFEYFDTAIL